MDGEVIDYLVDRGGYHGIVIEGTGGFGHVSESVRDALGGRAVEAGLPVVVSTRPYMAGLT